MIIKMTDGYVGNLARLWLSLCVTPLPHYVTVVRRKQLHWWFYDFFYEQETARNHTRTIYFFMSLVVFIDLWLHGNKNTSTTEKEGDIYEKTPVFPKVTGSRQSGLKGGAVSAETKRNHTTTEQWVETNTTVSHYGRDRYKNRALTSPAARDVRVDRSFVEPWCWKLPDSKDHVS